MLLDSCFTGKCVCVGGGGVKKGDFLEKMAQEIGSVANSGKPGTGIAAAATAHLFRTYLCAEYDENVYINLYCSNV